MKLTSRVICRNSLIVGTVVLLGSSRVNSAPLGADREVGGIILREGPQDMVQLSQNEWAFVSGPELFPVLSVTLSSGRFTYEIRHDRKYGSGGFRGMRCCIITTGSSGGSLTARRPIPVQKTLLRVMTSEHPFHYETSMKEIRDIRNGVVQLLAHAARDHDGIAIFHDPTAVHAATAYSHPSHVVASYQALQDVLEDLGFQYNYVVSPQVEAGILTQEGYRVLLLPYTLALSDKSAAAILAFVRAGGLLIVNVKPARYDYFFRPASNGPLLSEILGTPGEPFSARAGRTLVLADWVQDYSCKRHEKRDAEVRQLLQPLLAAHAIPPPVRFAVDGKDEPARPGVEAITLREANARYVGVINIVWSLLQRRPARPVKATTGISRAY